jgi:hypothetical protein
MPFGNVARFEVFDVAQQHDLAKGRLQLHHFVDNDAMHFHCGRQLIRGLRWLAVCSGMFSSVATLARSVGASGSPPHDRPKECPPRPLALRWVLQRGDIRILHDIVCVAGSDKLSCETSSEAKVLG